MLDVADCVNELAERFRIVELLGDPFRLGESLFRLRERGLEVGTYPTNDSRMIPAASRLYDAVVGGNLRHPDVEALNRHVATAIARRTRRGWRIDKARDGDRIDAVIAMSSPSTARSRAYPRSDWSAGYEVAVPQVRLAHRRRRFSLSALA